MSVRAMAWAWEQHGLSEGEKLLLMAIADHADDDGKAWPSQDRLGQKIGRSERTVRERLKKLESLELLVREQRHKENGHRTSDMIRLNMPTTTGKLYRRQTLPAATVVSEEPSVVEVGNKEEGVTTDKEHFDSPALATPKVQIDKLKLTDEEWEAAQKIMATFNEAAGTRFQLMGTRGRPTEHLKRIVSRMREHPEVTIEEHLEVVKRTCADPWWEDKPASVGVIYSPAAFPRCLATDSRPSHGRKFADERRTSAGDAPW
jgi:DNA-binding MarR family transcriptional regulator